MKKLLLILLCLPMIVFGQKKTIVVGVDVESSILNLKPNFGVFISNSVLVGTGFSYSSTNSISQITDQIILSPYIRFYDNSNIFFSIDYTFSQSTLMSETDTYVNFKNAIVGSNIGYSKNISDHLYLDPSIRLSYTSNYDNNGIDGYISEKPKAFQIEFVLGFHFRL